MRNSEQTLFLNVPQRWRISFPFILALAAIIFIVASAFYDLQYPYDGISILDPSGVIQELDPSGPTDKKLEVGDTIVSVAGVPFNEAFPFYPGKNPGDEVELVISRKGEFLPIRFILDQAPSSIVLSELVVITIA